MRSSVRNACVKCATTWTSPLNFSIVGISVGRRRRQCVPQSTHTLLHCVCVSEHACNTFVCAGTTYKVNNKSVSILGRTLSLAHACTHAESAIKVTTSLSHLRVFTTHPRMDFDINANYWHSCTSTHADCRIACACRTKLYNFLRNISWGSYCTLSLEAFYWFQQ